jgi:hypothetical protein
MANTGDQDGGEGAFRGFEGLKNLFGHVAELKEKLANVQQALAQKRVEGSAGGGMVVAIVNGKGELVGLRIEKGVVDPNDVDMLQDLIVAAVQKATRNARESMQDDISKLTGGIRIPGFPGLF